jgi:hypothetical protein
MASTQYEAWVERARAVPIEQEISRRGIKLKRDSKTEFVGPCPHCGGDNRFSINTSKQVFHCRHCKPKDIAGDVIGLVMFLDGVEFLPAVERLAGPRPKSNGNGHAGDHAAEDLVHEVCVATFPYTDESGTLLFMVGRLQYRRTDGSFVLKDGKPKKTFRQKRPDPERPGQWIKNVEDVRIIPYRLPEVIEAIGNGRPIVVVEGEAKADLLWSWNVPATCCVGGAKKWRAEHSEFLRDADVLILPDFDAPGREHADIVAQSLHGIAASIRVLELPGLPPKGDVIDWARQGGTVERLHDLIAHNAKDWAVDAEDKSKEEPPPDDEAKINDHAEGVSLDDFRAYMLLHNYIFTPSRELWPAASVNARLGTVPLVDTKGEPKLNKKGEQETVPASAWLDRHRPVEQTTWAPGLPMLIPDRLIADGGWITRPKVTCFNLYRPPTISRGNAAKAGPWLDHARKVFGGDADHIVKWLAHRVQRPAEKINHALVLGGKQGIGKDTLLEPLKAAVGPWNFIEVSPQQMLGRFNGFLKSVILRISEARDLGELNRFQFYDHLKAYTAAPPDVLRVDEKHLKEHSILNCCGVIITTNHLTDGIYLPADDRRHFVAWSPLSKDAFPDTYWRDLWHVAAYLAELKLSDFDAKAPPAKTSAFWSIVDASRAPEDAELADVLDHLGNPDATTLGRITAAAAGSFAEWLIDRKNRRAIPYRLEQCGYVPVRNDARAVGDRR